MTSVLENLVEYATCAPAACVLLAMLPRRITATPVLIMAIVWLPTLRGYFTDPALQRDNVRAAVHHVSEALEPGDVIVMSRDNFAADYYFTSDTRAHVLALPPGLHGILDNDAAVLNALNAALNAHAPKRVRLFLWQDDVVDPQRFLETTLRANGYQIGEYNFGQIRLPLYQIEHAPLTALPLRPNDAEFIADNGDRFTLQRSWFSPHAHTGDWLYAVLEWRTQITPARDYKVFVHVLNADGTIVFQQDKLTLSALMPTSHWHPDATKRDSYALVAPADLPPGRYHIRIGMYDPQSGTRLHTAQGGDAVVLGEVGIE